MELYKDYTVKITLSNTYIGPSVRQYKILKDRNNILNIPSEIRLWLQSNPESSDYTDQYRIYSETKSYNMLFILSVIREDENKNAGRIEFNLIYNSAVNVNVITSLSFKNVLPSIHIYKINRRVMCIVDIILGYIIINCSEDIDKWFYIEE